MTGLSATVTRKDGHHPIILMQCGPIRHRADARKQAAMRPFTHAGNTLAGWLRPAPATIDTVSYEDAGGLAERTLRARADLRDGLRSMRPAPAPAAATSAPDSTHD